MIDNPFKYWTEDHPVTVFTSQGKENKVESKVVYSGIFDPKYLKNLSAKSLIIIRNLEDKVCYSQNGEKSFKIVTFKSIDTIAKKVIMGTNEVFVWMERFHYKQGSGRDKIYKDDFEYKFYLMPKGFKPTVRKSTGMFDFKNRLDTTNLTHFMTVTVYDEKGYQN